MAGAISCTSITTSSSYSYLNGLRISGGDTGNTIFQPTRNLGITANTSYNIPFSIGSGNIITTVTDTGMTFKDYSILSYPNVIYFKNTTANKTISMTAGNLNVPENINVVGYINLESRAYSYLTFADKWKIGMATVNGYGNSLVFSHVDTGINSYWWMNGTQTSTQSDISDERIKKDITDADLDRCYEIVKTTPLKRFTWADGVFSEDQVKDQSNIGWIAQDVQKVFPKATNVVPFTKAVKLDDGTEEYQEQDFTVETVDETVTEIVIENDDPVQKTKIVSKEVKTLLFDDVAVVDEAKQPVMTTTKVAASSIATPGKVAVVQEGIDDASVEEMVDVEVPLTSPVPRMVTKTRPKVKDDIIEDCLDLNGGQMIAAMYGCVQKLQSTVEDLLARIAVLEGEKIDPTPIGKVDATPVQEATIKP